MAIKLVCAWCGKVLTEGEEPISHGICSECSKKEMEEWNDKKKRTKSREGGGGVRSKS